MLKLNRLVRIPDVGVFVRQTILDERTGEVYVKYRNCKRRITDRPT